MYRAAPLGGWEASLEGSNGGFAFLMLLACPFLAHSPGGGRAQKRKEHANPYIYIGGCAGRLGE